MTPAPATRTTAGGAPSVKVAPIRLKAIAGDDGVFEGYGSVFGHVDTYGDVVMPGAYAETLANHAAAGTRPKGLWQHDPAKPILTWLELREDDYGLFCRGRLLLDIQQAREAHVLMKAGELDGLSIGFEATAIEFARPDEFEAKYGAPVPGGCHVAPGEQVRVIRAVDLWEISSVTFPACAPARLTSVKTAPAPAPDLSPLVAALARRQAALSRHILA